MKYCNEKKNKINKTLHFTKSISFSLALASSLATSAFSLEFGGMGNVSAGLGGAGVALKQSQWALYYNPALLGVIKKSSFAYSFGAGYKETNLLSAADIKTDNITKMYDELNGLFSSTATNSGASSKPVVLSRQARSAVVTQNNGTTTNSDKNLPVSGIFSDVLANLLQKDSSTTTTPPTEEQLKDYLKKKCDPSTSCDNKPTNEILTELEKNPSKFDEVKKELSEAITKTEQQKPESKDALGILGGIVEGLTRENIEGFLREVGTDTSGGNVDITKLLSKMGGITLKAGSNATIDNFIAEMTKINKIIENNNLSVSTQNGLIITYSGKNNNWGISLGLLASAYANASATKSGNGYVISSGSDKYKVDVSSSGVMVSKGETSEQDTTFHISSNAIAFGEVPIGYGYAFDTRVGTFGLGIAGKYIHAGGYSLESSGGYDTIAKNISSSTKDIVQTSTWGIDAGLLYVPKFSKNLIFGVVGKNLNAPKIKTNKKSIELNTQVRAGVSYSLWKERIVFALDADLLANETLSTTRPYSQMVGGGVMFDFKYVDFRFGSMYDFRDTTKEGVILTGGINILGFLDIAVQSSLNLTPMPMVSNSLKLPSYLNVKIGGGFSW